MCRARRYTSDVVNRRLRFVACFVLGMWTTLPAAALVCQWECATGSTPAGHHAHHQTAVHGEHSDNASNFATLTSATGFTCDHVITVAPALTSPNAKLLSSPAVAVSTVSLPAASFALAVIGSPSTKSPPGARSVPLPLRI